MVSVRQGETGISESSNDRGFTLIELLVVVIILGVVAAISVVSVSGALKSATVKSCRADWQSVDSAMASYRTDNPSGDTLDSAPVAYLGKTYKSITLYRNEQGAISPSSLAGLKYISPLIDNRKTSYTILLLGDLPNPPTASYTILVQGAKSRDTAPYAQTDITACDNLGR